jgi:hypothetical protein
MRKGWFRLEYIKKGEKVWRDHCIYDMREEAESVAVELIRVGMAEKTKVIDFMPNYKT